ncbi:MAG: TldE/PmbA family protein [Oligoflexia bacterium]|nr:TldE/PmbA family protein [Oligoflexia bacterium]
MAPGEDTTLWLQGESSDFVRFNHGKVRQAGCVQQDELTLRLIRGQRHASVELSLSGQSLADRSLIESALFRLRARLEELPEDPHLLWETDGTSSTRVAAGAAPDGPAIASAVLDEAARDGGVDLVGVLVSGEVHVGFSSSRGQVNWDSRPSWLLDWCLYQQGDKAVKSTLGGTTWDPLALRRRMEIARAQLPALARPARRLSPGRYRAWLSPAALAEVMDLLSWGAFSHRAQEARNSPLLRMLTQGACLDPRVTLVEDLLGGLSPGFSPDGFERPAVVTLVDRGRLVGSLVSPRSAREYGLAQNGAGSDESPTSLALHPGRLADADVLAELGTGLFISNLWYLNYSDRPAGRITGMTRFATTWVENGEVVAPTQVMRFDETIFHLLGEGLVALGQEATLLPSTSTYERRSTDSLRLPGALVDGMRFTL